MSDIPRDRFGRPLIVPPEGGKAVPYTRATTVSESLADTYNLTQWKLRKTAWGLAGRRDLLAAVTASEEDPSILNGIVASAMEAAESNAAATMGTALHALTEQIDVGLKPVVSDSAMRADLDAYSATLKASGAEVECIECFGVEDEMRIAGTADRTLRLPDGRLVIADIKTGRVDYAAPSIAIQLALYAHMADYDIETGKRTERGVDLDTAIVIHLPAGKAECVWYDVDIRAGWEAAQLAMTVRAWRKRKDLLRPRPVEDEVMQAIATAADELAMRKVWQRYADRWDDDYTELAKAKIALLKAGVTGGSR